MNDFLHDKVREIRARMDELEPLADEHRRLTAAADALDRTATTSEFLADKQQEIRDRVAELEPLIAEYAPLRDAVEALEGTLSGDAGGARRSRGGRGAKARPSGGSSGDGERRRGGRPKGSGTRGKEAMAIIGRQPGATIPEIAEQMGIKQNYLYRVLPDLQKEGLVRKEGRGWHLTDAA